MRRALTLSVLVAFGGCAAPAIDSALDTDGVNLPDRVPGADDGGTTTTTTTDSAPRGPDNVTLTVTLSGSGTGTLSSTPSGLTCTGTTCKGTFAKGTVVNLAATPGAGSVFAGWNGPCTSTMASCAPPALATDVTGSAAFQSLAGPWAGTYTNNRVASGCPFTNAGNLTIALKNTAGAFSSTGAITGLELRQIPSCALVTKTTGSASDAPVTVVNDTLTGTWTFNVAGAGGSLAFPFTAKVAGKTMTGTWTCPTCTGSFTLTTP